MKTNTILTLILFLNVFLYGQEVVKWSPTEVITSASFKATVPEMVEDNQQQYYFSATWGFAYQMTNIQFVMTKNFNSYVQTTYQPALSWIESGELTKKLLLMVNLHFDVLELFSRKFRKGLYDAKNIGSSTNFFEVVHQQVNNELATFQAKLRSELTASKHADEVILRYDEEVNRDIQLLAEYCETCKPTKKKKIKSKRKRGK